MGNTYFVTGFPGFIATALVTNLIQSGHSIDAIYVLSLQQFSQKSVAEAERISLQSGFPLDRLTVVVGDITQSELGMDTRINETLRSSITHVFHLAAIYDLSVSEDIARRVNVHGTACVNHWVRSLEHLERYIYFSTAYVSGLREGRIFETDLRMGQRFKNHYESTKYEAEVLVDALKKELPVTIIRPGIVKGHSKTGETIKFDGPYFMLQFINRLRWLPLLPYLGRGRAEGNFVPVDYIFDATLYLAHLPAGVGKTYHLTDPSPYPMKDVYKMLMETLLGRQPHGMVPLAVAHLVLSNSAFRKYARVEKEALDYFTCMASYDCSQAQEDLQDSGIACPDFRETVSSMVTFYREHAKDGDKQIQIR